MDKPDPTMLYLIGHNILRYQALPWHISYQETVCFLGGGALYSAFSTYPTDHIRARGISVQTLWVLVFRGVNDLSREGSFRRNDPSINLIGFRMGRTGVLRQQHVLGGRNPWGGRGGLVSGFWVFDIAGVLSKYRAIDEPTGIMVSGFCSESEVGDAPRCHALLWLTGGRPAMRSGPPGCRDPERKRRGCLMHRTPTGGAVACHAQALKG